MGDYDKPFIAYPDMVSLLKSRGLIIDDEPFALGSLDYMSYYTIVNGYIDELFYDSSQDRFLNDLQFEDLYTLHILDTSINHLLLKYILYIEGALKSRVSYIVSQNHGVWTDVSDDKNKNPDDYLYRSNYSVNTGRRNSTLRKLKHYLQFPRPNDSSIQHYIKNHNHIPPWVLTTAISFYDAILWYEILNSEDKSYVTNAFIPTSSLNDMEKKEYLRQSFELMHEFRNKAAHGTPVFASKSKYIIPKKQLIFLSKGIITKSDLKRYASAQNGLLAMLPVVLSLLNDPYLRNSFKAELTGILGLYIKQDLKIGGTPIYSLFGLPPDILNRIVAY